MVLKFSGQFNRDIAHRSRKLSDEIQQAILNLKNASQISQIQNLVKLRKYEVHYRIQVAKDYRIGVMIRGEKIWIMRFGHRNLFYKKIFP